MACNCGSGGGRKKDGQRLVGYEITSYQNEKLGPFLTRMEAMTKLSELGGGTITPVYE